uniref:DNA-directed RNA polymerase subunit beta n=1 Tax=Cyanophora biloba TaxID=1489483 RepID=A0A2Z4HG87_9EUKA|nr:RNA polymerase beta subunit [Cyanophora biloba]AWW13758.1 RNA polymerase beta subunit [Cyanophora biloba]
MSQLTDTSLIPFDLLEIQKASFKWFFEEGLIEEIENFSPVIDLRGNFEVHFYTRNYELEKPNFTLEEAKQRDLTYAAQLYIPTELRDLETGIVKQDRIFFGEIPLMTDRCTFIINGVERVIINQIIRSPGIYYSVNTDEQGIRTYDVTIISNRGAWLKFEIDKDDLIWMRIDKTHKLPCHIFLKALNLSENEILNALSHPEFFQKTIYEHGEYTEEEALIEFHRQLRPGEPPNSIQGRYLLYSRFFDPKRYDLGFVGRYKLNKKLNLNISPTIRVLTTQDILEILNYLINIQFGMGQIDDIDHLGNRRVKAVGELLQSQLRIGLNRLERLIHDRLSMLTTKSFKKRKKLTTLINAKPINECLKEFFGSSQLSQFMDQTNPLAELIHKRRLTILGPGGLSRDRAGCAVRDIHPSHYGRICPIETPEGQNAGLVGSLTTHAHLNKYGFIETPFYKVQNGYIKKENKMIYLTADEEDQFRIAAADVMIDQNNKIIGDDISVRYRQEFITAKPDQIDFIAISPLQTFSVSTSLIPFLEHDDANRALMGSNMQRQAVPLLYAQKPLVGTGLEFQVAKDSRRVIISKTQGLVQRVTGDSICIKDQKGKEFNYNLVKYQRSNQDTCITQRPIVFEGEKIIKGQILADDTATDKGELALGQNLIVAYMPWEGYNYEDAILISERLVYEDVYTSIHIEKYETETRQTKLGIEEITREIPNINEYSLRNLDEKGIVSVGSWVKGGDILVGKVAPKAESEQPPEGKLLKAIFGEKNRDVRDTSLRMSSGEKGRIVDVRIFIREFGEMLYPGTNTANTIVRIHIAQKRKIQVGDKMAGRHGNKGIISKILPRQDMPYLPDGTPIDIILNPLGVPSRMNVGQVYECLLGWAASHLGVRFKLVPFDERFGKQASRTFVHQKLQEAKEFTGKNWLFNPKNPGKIQLFDGRTGESFDNPIMVGKAYMLKLVHLVDDKIHARSTGPYSLITQQPLGGKAQQGGQRFGEMEVWALEAFGAAYTLQEILTIKSDDMLGRNEALKAIVKGKAIPRPGIPESFKVLMRELQALCLDVVAYKIQTLDEGKREALAIDLSGSLSTPIDNIVKEVIQQEELGEELTS